MASGVNPFRLTLFALALLVAGCSAPPPVVPLPSPRAKPASEPPAPEATRDDSPLNGEEEFAPPPPPDPPVPADSLADRLLEVAMVEAREAIKLYNNVVIRAIEDRPDAQNRARQRVLEAALTSERAETLMRVRFALLGGIPNEAEGEMRLYLSFLSTAADDLMEVDAIDGDALLGNLDELTRPLLDAMKRIPTFTEEQ